MAMAPAIQNVKDDVMINNHDECKDDLRTNVYILLEELKRVGSGIGCTTSAQILSSSLGV
jgi:hypothetical protein